MSKFYPKIETLVALDDLPKELNFLQEPLQQAFDKVYYRSFQADMDLSGGSIAYSLQLVLYKQIGFAVPGTGLEIVLNPASNQVKDPNYNPGVDGTHIPVNINYTLGIKKYLPNFGLNNFSFEPDAFFNIIQDILQFNEKGLIVNTTSAFLSDNSDPLNQFAKDLNNSGHLSNSIQLPLNSDYEQALTDIVNHVENNSSESLSYIIFDVYINAANLEDTLVNLHEFLSIAWSEEGAAGIERLFYPQINVAINLNAGILFPRNVLLPLEQDNGGYSVVDNDKFQLKFDAGEFYFDTSGNIGFDEDLTLTPTPYPKAQIGKTGMSLSFSSAKLDLSKKTNIPEADEDGRPTDFTGIYIKDASIGLPDFLQEDQGYGKTQAAIKANNLLIGTGGISGTIGLDNSGNKLGLRLGSQNGFAVELDTFSIEFQQNAIIESSITGELTIPKFENSGGGTYKIDIDAAFDHEGHFSLTANAPANLPPLKLPQVFSLDLDSLSLGNKENPNTGETSFFVGVSGVLAFDPNSPIGSILSANIPIKNLMIWEDGSVEIEGGSLPLPGGVSLSLGPAEIAITNIHFGSHQQKDGNGNMRKYRYWGFDGGISVDPGGVDARGDSIKFYYTVDDNDTLGLDTFISIQSLHIDLVIPGDASGKSATAIIEGYLSVKGGPGSGNTEYAGGIDFKLPKANIAGGAGMAYQPKQPAWLVDAHLELSSPIPLGSTGLGIYGFRGLVGQRYVADKSEIGLSDKSWFDYYKHDEGSGQGIYEAKMEGPPDSMDSSTNPFSVGAGASLATTSDGGNAFSTKLFFLLSLPNVILLEGKANVLGERVGLSSQDPPYFAVIILDPGSSVETGFGANYLVPKGNGGIVDFYVEAEAAYFFDDPDAWYVNFGTKQDRIKGEVLTIFQAETYLMLSASGIAAGARVGWDFNKSYGPVKASVKAYASAEGKVSFERPQIGGYAALGGHVDVELLGVGFFFSIDTRLSVQAPKPFRIEGSVELCVGVDLLFTEVEKCFTVDFAWTKDDSPDNSPINPIDVDQTAVKSPASAINIHTGDTFEIHYFGENISNPNSAELDDKVIPMDTYIDFEFSKGLKPNAVRDQVYGVNNGPDNYMDKIPPLDVGHQQKHEYAIESIEIQALDDNNNWVDYHPYEALITPDALSNLNANPSEYKLGAWQKTDRTYNKLRLLAQTPFSYMDKGEKGWYTPEKFGLTSATLFCETQLKDPTCLRWSDHSTGETFEANTLYNDNDIGVLVQDGEGKVKDFNNIYGIPKSLMFKNENNLEIYFQEPSARVELKLFTYAKGVKIHFYSDLIVEVTIGSYENSEVYLDTIDKERSELFSPVTYENPNHKITKAIVQPYHSDEELIEDLQIQNSGFQRQLYEDLSLSDSEKIIINSQIDANKDQIEGEQAKECVENDFTQSDINNLINQADDPSKECEKCGYGINDISDPGFENQDSFNTDYSQNSNLNNGQFQFTGDVSNLNSDLTGKPKMGQKFVAFNGSTQSGQGVWRTETTVNQDQTYCFSFWLNSLSAVNPAKLQVKITALDGDGHEESITVRAFDIINTWEQVRLPFHSTNNSLVLIEITNLNTDSEGNYFGLDGLYFGESNASINYCFEGQNLLINPDFELGNTGFNSDYSYNQVGQYGTYFIVEDASSIGSAGWPSTPQKGDKHLVVDGATESGLVLWQETLDIRINQKYHFCGFITSNSPSLGQNKQANLEIRFICKGEIVDSFTVQAPTNNNWTQFSHEFDSLLNNEVTIEIINTTLIENGNDFALDNLYFGEKYETKACPDSSKSNFLQNPDFELGNYGFESDYDFYDVGNFGNYYIVYDASSVGSWSSTPQSGTKHMVVDGEANISGLPFWRQKISNVEHDTKYFFTGWIYNNSPDQSPFDIKVKMTDNNGNIQNSSFETPSNAVWEKFSIEWYSGSSHSVTIEMINNELKQSGNDFAIDNLHFGKKVISSNVDGLKEFNEMLDNGDYQRPSDEGHCATFIHEICSLSYDDHSFNKHVPSQEAIEEDFKATKEAFEKTLAPIWRPNTKYHIKLLLSDNVKTSSNQNKHTASFSFGFRTEGPVGYFHEEYNEYHTPPNTVTAENSKLANIRSYIDYSKSYPNADGNLVSAKPLFYKNTNNDCKLLLFFNERYFYHMVNSWPPYNNMASIDGSLEAVIKDPSENVTLSNPPDPNVTQNKIPEGVVEWKETNKQIMPESLRQYRNLKSPEELNPDFVGGECKLVGGDPIQPAAVMTEIKLKHLQPSKLYTAIFNNKFNTESREVHRYVFRTSRYGDFQEQIKSYKLKDEEGNHQKDAIFDINKSLTGDDVDLAYNIIIGNMTTDNQALVTDYAHPFDRLIKGALKLDSLNPSEGTEFNVVKNNGDIIGVWVRNPEPFNDPKTPTNELEDAVLFGSNSIPVDPDKFRFIFSKDLSEIFFMHESKIIPSGSYGMRFLYKLWNGEFYEEKDHAWAFQLQLD